MFYSILSLVEIVSIATLSNTTQLSIVTCSLAIQASLVEILFIFFNVTPRRVACVVAHDRFSTSAFTNRKFVMCNYTCKWFKSCNADRIATRDV